MTRLVSKTPSTTNFGRYNHDPYLPVWAHDYANTENCEIEFVCCMSDDMPHSKPLALDLYKCFSIEPKTYCVYEKIEQILFVTLFLIVGSFLLGGLTCLIYIAKSTLGIDLFEGPSIFHDLLY